MIKIRQPLTVLCLSCAVVCAVLSATEAMATTKVKPKVARTHSHPRTHFYLGGIFMPAPVIYPRPVPVPSVVQIPAPTVYIEKSELEAGGSTPAYWYLCSSLNTYYPYVAECPEPWVAVIPDAAPVE